MKSELVIINQRLEKYAKEGSSFVSFVPFFDHIKRLSAGEKTFKRHLFQYILEQFEKHPEWLLDIPVSKIGEYSFLFELVYSASVPTVFDEHNFFWALGLPLKPVIFYGTDSFYALIEKRRKSKIPDSVRYSTDEKLDHWHNNFIYSFILREVYHFPVLPHDEFTYSFVEEETGLLKYLTIKADLRFVKIRTSGDFPILDIKRISGAMDRQDIEYLTEVLPLSLFSFEGFSIRRVHDSTATNILENVRNAIIEQNPRDLISTYEEVLTLLKSLIGNAHVNFGILPMLQINHHLVVPYASLPFSFLVKTSRELAIQEDLFLEYLSRYKSEPRLYFYHSNEEIDEASPFAGVFHQAGINTLALVPVFHNNSLVGVLEVHTQMLNALTESSLSLLENVLPLLAQLLQKSIHDFNSYIDYKIKTSFTSIQPSVEWKFKEAIWSQMKEFKFDRRHLSVPTVGFTNVHPMYGAIDIRNSTAERNKALQSDLLLQSSVLIHLLEALKSKVNLPQANDLLLSSMKWHEKIDKYLLTSDEMDFNDFLLREINPFLQYVQSTYPEECDGVTSFQELCDEKKGEAFKNRRALELSIHKINTSVSSHIDQFRKQLQRLYPIYFEKFRTDGVEYDIYVGQSIAPEKTFEYSYLSDFRMMQLRSMADIVRLTHAMLPELPTPLYTTQLIFINPSPIDISFRNDERRFDVEGAYNIRYQVIKKRIDKVNIKGTSERLTQPGKIALVYYNNLEAEEYRKYIHQLQSDEVLHLDFEELELEELQGISGLRAMRVSVRVEEEVAIEIK